MLEFGGSEAASQPLVEFLGAGRETLIQAAYVPDEALGPFFAATIQAIDEAVLNALTANETMVGINDRVIHALPHDEVRRLLGLAS